MSSELEAKLAQLKRLHELGLLTDAYQDQPKAITAAALGTTPAAPAPAPAAPPVASLSGATRVDGRRRSMNGQSAFYGQSAFWGMAFVASRTAASSRVRSRAVGRSEPPRAAQSWSARCAASSR